VKYRVLAVGRRANDPLVVAADTYVARLAHYVPCELIRIRDDTHERERQQLLRLLRDDELLVALDERGRQYTTRDLATRLEQWRMNGIHNIVFVVGGADGLHDDIKQRARETWSLSRLTLPHRLALVVLFEQLYRAHTILRGEPYHRD
jgi:23S rRNA (pseudouridine1915-N3)-methyltransferase